MTNQSIQKVFFEECDEQLAELELNLLAIESAGHDTEKVNAVFRAVHSIKGGAGAFGMEDLVAFAHAFETTLDQVRSGGLTPDATVLQALFKASYVLADLVRLARDGGNTDTTEAGAVAEQLHDLCCMSANNDEDEDGDEDEFVFVPVPVCLEELGLSDLDQPDVFDISFKPHEMLYQNGNDALFILRALQSLGEIAVNCSAGDLPSFDEIDPQGAFLTWKIELSGDCDESAIREIFEFVERDCDLSIISRQVALGGELEPSAAPEPAADVPSLQESEELAPPAGSLESESPQLVGESKRPPQATIRVDLNRVEHLINLIGELVINISMLEELAANSGMRRKSALSGGFVDLQKLTKDIQGSVMAIRAQPVKTVFQRMDRVVREASNAIGKVVRLETSGEDTEVDQTIVERLSGPLTHMLRNAIDHGLESPQERIGLGKPEEGTVCLLACHRSGRVLIEIADDGAGINRDKVKSIAIKKGLIAPDAALTDEEADNLIFMPGFSTATQVSDLSGRGVGLDVVRRSVEELGGQVSIASKPGHGTKFSISLPLTLAVMEGLVVTVADQTLIVPLTAIVETLKPHEDIVNEIGQTNHLIRLNDEFVPLVDLAASLGFRSTRTDPTQAVAVLVENERGARSALLVDAILGQSQVVIKSLETNFRKVPGIAAATILGDGRVALIADTDRLVTQHAPGVGARQTSLQMTGAST